MFKKLFLFASVALIMAACNNAGQTDSADTNADVVMITSVDFNTNPDDFVGKNIIIEGTVVHVCQHGGKRMFIVGNEEEEDRIQIKAGDEIDAFDVELEGSDVSVSGIFYELRIDEPYLTEWENELKANNPDSELKIHRGEEGHEHGEESDAEVEAAHEFEQIDAYRTQMKDEGVDHLSYYSIIASEYKEKK